MKTFAFALLMTLCGVVEAKPEVIEGDFLTSFMDGLANGSANEVCYERQMQYLMGNGELYGAANAMAILRSIDPVDPECVRGAMEAITDYENMMLEPVEGESEEYVAN